MMVGFAALVSAVCRISRMLYRARIFRFRKRPNLALSPFLADIISPLDELSTTVPLADKLDCC
jgi:hypothetical protein